MAYDRPDVVNVLDYGADPTGVANSAAAIQAALDAANSFFPWKMTYIPAGTYLVNTTINLPAGFDIRGDSGGSWLKTTSNIAILQFNPDVAGSAYNVSIRDLHFVGTSAGTSTRGLRITGNTPSTTASNALIYGSFSNLVFNGFYDAIYFDKANPVLGGPEGTGIDWNQWANIRILGCSYGFRWARGSGTGNVYTNLIVVTTVCGLYFGGVTQDIIGDVVIVGVQGCSSGTGIYGAPTTTGGYRARFTILGYQFDAGATRALDFDGYEAVTAIGVSGGGAIDMNFVNNVHSTLIDTGGTTRYRVFTDLPSSSAGLPSGSLYRVGSGPTLLGIV